MIEKGVDPNKNFRERKGVGQDPLFWGFLFAGMGIGILLGYILSKLMGWDEKVLINAMAVFLGGSGMIVYHIYRKNTDDQHPL
jgi:Na+-driven multidrug efflux pump